MDIYTYSGKYVFWILSKTAINILHCWLPLVYHNLNKYQETENFHLIPVLIHTTGPAAP